ncbi:YybH family protein [Undibacterium arcticum]
MAATRTTLSSSFDPEKCWLEKSAIRSFTETATSLSITFQSHDFVETSNTALHYSKWTLTLPSDTGTTQELSGCTTDVLRKQADGDWLITIDNAWGIAVLG